MILLYYENRTYEHKTQILETGEYHLGDISEVAQSSRWAPCNTRLLLFRSASYFHGKTSFQVRNQMKRVISLEMSPKKMKYFQRYSSFLVFTRMIRK